jgi:hypothetical protein
VLRVRARAEVTGDDVVAVDAKQLVERRSAWLSSVVNVYVLVTVAWGLAVAAKAGAASNSAPATVPDAATAAPARARPRRRGARPAPFWLVCAVVSMDMSFRYMVCFGVGW